MKGELIMKESSKAAIGGIVSALSVVIMLCTYISPLLVYTAPPFAGLLLILIVNELGYKWAAGTYVTISILSIFVIADKESAVFFTLLFGYYPILSLFLDNKMKIKPLRKILKLIIFNSACISSILMCMFVFNITYDDLFDGGVILAVIFALLLNILFFSYDTLVSKMHILYKLKFQKKFRKLFNIR